MDLLNQLAQDGVLSLLLAISFWAIYSLFRELQRQWNERLIDREKSQEAITSMAEPMKELRRTIEASLKIMEEIARK